MKTPVKVAIAVAILLIGLFVAFKIIYNKQDDKTKAALNVIGLNVESWNTRAAAAVKATANVTLAESIIAATHPTGKGAVLGQVTTKDLGGDRMSAQIAVNWKGGIIGTDYTTVIEWTFNKISHEGVTVASDTAKVAIAKNNLEDLNKYFATNVYPVVKKNIN